MVLGSELNRKTELASESSGWSGVIHWWLDTMATALPVYHGAISKKECENLLATNGKDGAYLIRDSHTIQGAMCLCVLKKNVVYTYRLLQSHSGSFTLQTASGVKEKFFNTLSDLVQHYKRRNQGLAVPLRHSVKRKTELKLPGPEVADEEHDYENIPDTAEYVDVIPS